MLDTLKTLCALDGVTGNEDKVREYIKAQVEPYADEIITDAMGNLIVFKKGKKDIGKTVMLAAHMDEVGIMVTHVTDDGYVKFAAAGGIDRRVLIGKEVFIGDDRVYGVIGNKAIHLVKPEERTKIPKVDDMYIDIGVNSKEDALKLVSLGDTGSFDNSVYEYGDGMLKAKAIDDRVGCAVMIDLIKNELPVDCWFAFTVQEEVGTRGAFGAAFRVKPDVCLVVEGTTAADLPSVQGVKKVCAPKKGVVIPFMDRGAIYDKNLHKFVTKLADDNGIKWQVKSMIAGGTDAQAIQRSRAGVRAAGIAAAIRNIHSPASTASIEDIKGLRALAQLFLENIEAELN
ncbi:MAG: M20/M25/M40 family metallo-hydrolase [Oscillospiraceae bacterium]|nr:M20/M25/M40 family metallo-hydrolase [Oscillospiraceae bacterium]